MLATHLSAPAEPVPQVALRTCQATSCHRKLPATSRRDKLYCSDACRVYQWKADSGIPSSAISVENFRDLRDRVELLAADWPSQPMPIGYCLRATIEPVGTLLFPEPGRMTKRAPDRRGHSPFSTKPYFGAVPFDYPRVPVESEYQLILYMSDGSLYETVWIFQIDAVFPSVRLYDETFLYDLCGNKWPKGTPKPKTTDRPRRPRRRRLADSGNPGGIPSDSLASTAPPPLYESPKLATDPTLAATVSRLERVVTEQSEQIRQQSEQIQRQSNQIDALVGALAKRTEPMALPNDRDRRADLDRERREREAERISYREKVEQMAAQIRQLEQSLAALRDSQQIAERPIATPTVPSTAATASSLPVEAQATAGSPAVPINNAPIPTATSPPPVTQTKATGPPVRPTYVDGRGAAGLLQRHGASGLGPDAYRKSPERGR